ncbi:hypothetical protein ACO2Q0_02790 [Phenylobacterium sp. VNQ135]|uniref:hypothetical protein n=1 Tax=Phenylobacterium sp. VNQ135 TaxID=3400922 RepID=UPI003C01467E
METPMSQDPKDALDAALYLTVAERCKGASFAAAGELGELLAIAADLLAGAVRPEPADTEHWKGVDGSVHGVAFHPLAGGEPRTLKGAIPKVPPQDCGGPDAA